MNFNQKGNTVTDTLIAIAMTGVVLTVFIGSFVADYNKKQTVVNLKNKYSTLNTAIQQSIKNNSKPINWKIEKGVSPEGSYFLFEKYLLPYLKVERDCKNSTEGGCSFDYKELNGTEKNLKPEWARFYLEDGSRMAVLSYNDDKYKVLYFITDINGNRRLNISGRDIFMFVYWIKNIDYPEYEGKLLPFGHEYARIELISDSDKNNCNINTSGNYCSALIIKDNWKIIKGYPWMQARYNVK